MYLVLTHITLISVGYKEQFLVNAITCINMQHGRLCRRVVKMTQTVDCQGCHSLDDKLSDQQSEIAVFFRRSCSTVSNFFFFLFFPQFEKYQAK